MSATSTPIPTATPVIWPTLTPYPTSAATPAFDLDSNDAFVVMAEKGVQMWQTANQDGLMDNVMTVVIVIIIVLTLRILIVKLSSL